MDPVSLFIGVLVLAGAFKVGVKATADGYATVKAAGSGQFDFIDADRRRRADFREKLAAAWAERRTARARQAGDVDGDYRPGARAYAADLWQGFWEDRLDHLAKRRAARAEWAPPETPFRQRLAAAVAAKAERLREARAGEKAKALGHWFIHGRQPQPTAPEVAEVQPAVAEPAEPAAVTPPSDPAPAAPDVETPDPATPEPTEEPDMTAPATNTAAATGDVNNNEDARRHFQEQIAAANDATDALAVYEAAQTRLVAAGAGLEGINAQRFDRQAQAAAANTDDLLPATGMSQAAAAIDGIRAAAESGLAALDKYRDAEDVVNANQVDGRTLETADSA